MTVKGISEMDVKSDLGIWEINYREVGNNLNQINQQLTHDQQTVVTFLKQQQFTDNEIEFTGLKVEDRLANVYSQTNDKPDQARYVVTGGIRIRSSHVEQMEKTVPLANTLLDQGVTIAFDSTVVSPNPSYYYMQLDKIRPQMMSEATKSAKTIADRFAADSNSQLGGIQHASQGVFQIMGRDTSTMNADWNSNQNSLGSIDKKVRLVTTIDYQLK